MKFSTETDEKSRKKIEFEKNIFSMVDIIEKQQQEKKKSFVSINCNNMRREERNLAIIIELIVSSVISQLPEILIIYVPVPRFLMMLKNASRIIDMFTIFQLKRKLMA